jgi:hypothetical protein
MQHHADAIAAFSEQLQAAQKAKDADAMRRAMLERRAFMARHGLLMRYVMLPALVQLPVFVTFFSTLRQLAREAHLAPLQGLAGGAASGVAGGPPSSALWLTALHLPDPTFALPVLSAALSALAIRINQNLQGVPQLDLTPGGQKVLFGALSVVFTLATALLPATVGPRGRSCRRCSAASSARRTRRGGAAPSPSPPPPPPPPPAATRTRTRPPRPRRARRRAQTPTFLEQSHAATDTFALLYQQHRTHTSRRPTRYQIRPRTPRRPDLRARNATDHFQITATVDSVTSGRGVRHGRHLRDDGAHRGRLQEARGQAGEHLGGGRRARARARKGPVFRASVAAARHARDGEKGRRGWVQAPGGPDSTTCRAAGGQRPGDGWRTTTDALA